jgi:hypothetical protein
MPNFKIVFPAGYQIKNYYNDNLDVNIILDSDKVFFGTLFTPMNIDFLIKGDIFFWATDMLVVRDLKKNTIRRAITKIINEGHLSNIFSEIGEINKVIPGKKNFSEIEDMCQ